MYKSKEMSGTGLVLSSGNRDLRVFTKHILPRKVLALISYKAFKPRISWIAKALGVGIEETQDAIELLESLGLAKWNEGKLEAVEEVIYVDEQLKTRSKADLISDHRMISHQILNDVRHDDRFFVRNGFNSTDEEILKKFHEKIMEAERWFKEASLKSKHTISVEYTLTGTNFIKGDYQ